MNLGNATERLASRLPIPSALAGKVYRERGPVVAMVRLHGIITPTPSPLGRGTINLSGIETALTRAFDQERLQAVALAVNSPGGSPTQSALVADRIRGLAKDKGVPVLACCEDVAASGGYWLACAADEIIAHPTSLVGSIGVISQGFGLHNLLERWGVERRLYTVGQNKARLDPFLPESDEDVAWLHRMQTELHRMFTDWVRCRRGDKLRDGEDLFTGEVWTGARAVELGLIDGVGTLRSVVSQRYPDAEITTIEPRKPLLARLGFRPAATGASGPDAVLAALEALEHRATWSRFGL